MHIARSTHRNVSSESELLLASARLHLDADTANRAHAAISRGIDWELHHCLWQPIGGQRHTMAMIEEGWNAFHFSA